MSSLTERPAPSAEPDGAPEAPEADFVAAAAGVDDPPPPVKGLTRLMRWIVPGNVGLFLLWGAIPSILLPQQISDQFGEDDKVRNLAIVATIGAFAAMIAQPVAGQLSDRTRSRFGRRAPWMIAGALAGALALVGLALAHTLVGIAIAWTLVQICFNFAQGPLSAVMPDRVPVARRGSFAALTGVGTMVGALGGQVVGSLFFDDVAAGYIVFAVIAVLGLVLFNVFNPDYPSTDLVPEPFRLGEFLRGFRISPREHPDFFWAFLGRLLLYTGYFTVTGYQLYLLQDYFDVDKPDDIIPVLGVISLVGILVATAISGPLSDRIGRRKPFVFASSVVTGFAMIVPWVWQDLAAWMVMTFIAGLGFGMFQSVDTALMSQVLPSAKSFAKDLGVVNVAATLPQTLAPAVAGGIVLVFGYAALFPVGIVLSVLGALAVWPIKAVR
jgi:MFS family permease